MKHQVGALFKITEASAELSTQGAMRPKNAARLMSVAAKAPRTKTPVKAATQPVGVGSRIGLSASKADDDFFEEF